MQKYDIDVSDDTNEEDCSDNIEKQETESKEDEDSENLEKQKVKDSSHFASTYSLKSNENYESNHYNYETDRYGRIKRCEGTLRLEEGKRNSAHQLKAGGEYRMENDEGGHLIAKRFGGSEKIDNIVAMDEHVNRVEYRKIENDWANKLKKGNTVDVKILCKYENESTRPTEFIVKYKVTDQNGAVRYEVKAISNNESSNKG